MSMAYIRSYYGVPAKRRMRVTASGQPGVIVAAKGCYLRIRLDGEKYRRLNYHPTWQIEYHPKAKE